MVPIWKLYHIGKMLILKMRKIQKNSKYLFKLYFKKDNAKIGCQKRKGCILDILRAIYKVQRIDYKIKYGRFQLSLVADKISKNSTLGIVEIRVSR